MSNAVKKFNGLKGAVGIETVEKIAKLAKQEGQTALYERLQKGIEAAKGRKDVLFNPGPLAFEQVPRCDLPGLEPLPDYISAEDFTGLNKAVSPDEIYQYITDLILKSIENAGHLPWHQMWEKKQGNFKFYKNFDTKKPYRGINFMLLNLDEEGDIAHRDNPYFLTFKQIEKHGGQIKKGSKGKRIVYFVQLYQFQHFTKDGKKTMEFATYNHKKYVDWLHKNKTEIEAKTGKSIDKFENTYIPILKYYNVFSGEDVTGIDFGDFPKTKAVEIPESERIETAEAIIANYPNPPKIEFTGNQPAFYPTLDLIKMTPIEQFKTPQFFYSVFFHELTHSTGHSKRLDRGNDTRKRDGSAEDKKAYDFEELVAEMGSVFLCAESGILFSTRDQSAKYLDHYINKLKKRMKEDNRFFFRAASASQAAADYILDRDKDGKPKYLTQKKTAGIIPKIYAHFEKQIANGGERDMELIIYDIGKGKFMAIAQDGRVVATAVEGTKEETTFNRQAVFTFHDDLDAVVSRLKENSFEVIVFEVKNGKITKRKNAAPSKKPIGYAPKKKHKFRKGDIVQLSKKWGKDKAGTTGKVRDLRKSVHGDPMYAIIIGKQYRIFPETVLQLPKKKLTKKELEEANPAPKAIKPKSIAVTTAVKDILGLDKYNHKEVSPLKANLVYNLFKNADLDQVEILAENPSDYALAVLKKDGPFHSTWPSDEIELTDLGRDFIKAVNNRLESLRNQKHNYALFEGLMAANPEISTDKFKNMTVPELRLFTYNYYNRHLKGKGNVYVKNRLHKIDFISDGSRKILKPMYSTKAAVIEHLETIIENSTYNNFGERKKNDPPNVIGYLNFKSKVTIDGEKRHVRISLRLDRDKTTKFKGYEVGAKEKQAKSARAAVANPKDGQKKPVSENKITKTKPNHKKSGLKSPTIEPKPTEGGQSYSGESPRPLISGKHPKVRSIKHQAEKNPMFAINGETSRFLQAVEKKPFGSVVVTLDGPQGAGKTTAIYKFQNDFAEAGNRCLFASLEEHPSSNLATDKKDAYLSPAAQENIDTVGSFASYAEFCEIVDHYDCVFIDSWQKLVRMIGAIRLDEDVRKKFDGKVFFVIFQQTTEGRTKGGAEIVFDGDIIIKLEKCASFTDNYAYFDKNRYTTVPIETIKYMIAEGRTVIEGETGSSTAENAATAVPLQNEVSADTAENEETLNFRVY